ncbi:hypothetical protein [Streptomyces sp. NPDC101455]|uniref:hypothetical protein n=1 Tax=Streptomyces sp. NPDC101455 TaxID=3366142 RepID=UPI003804B6A4
MSRYIGAPNVISGWRRLSQTGAGDRVREGGALHADADSTTVATFFISDRIHDHI